MKPFWDKHKVFIVGLLSAVALALNELMTSGEVSAKILAYAGFIAALSYLSKNLRGQWATITGIVLTALATYIEQERMGTVTWRQIILQATIALLAAIAPPPKSIEYEKSPTIVQAKEEAATQIIVKDQGTEVVPPTKPNEPLKPV